MTEDTSETPRSDAPSASPGPGLTPVRLAILLAGATACAAVGMRFHMARLSDRVVFPVVEGISDLDRAVARAGVEESLVRVSRGDGEIDILFAGTPECPYCRQFVTGEFDGYEAMSFDEMALAADRAGLDLAYMPVATGQISAMIAGARKCADNRGTGAPMSGRESVSTSYAVLDIISGAETEAHDLSLEGAPAIDIDAVYGDALDALFASFGDLEGYDRTCHTEAGAESVAQSRAFMKVFGKFGTPAFFFEAHDGGVRSFSGALGVERMIRDLRR